MIYVSPPGKSRVCKILHCMLKAEFIAEFGPVSMSCSLKWLTDCDIWNLDKSGCWHAAITSRPYLVRGYC